MEPLRGVLLRRLEDLRSGSNPFFPQDFSSGGDTHRSTATRGGDYKRYGELFVKVRDAEDNSPIIAEIADEVMPGWRDGRTGD